MPLTLKKAFLFQSLRENLHHFFGAFLRDKLWRNYKEFFVLFALCVKFKFTRP